MKEGNQDNIDTISRRSVLRKGTVATGAILAGGAAMSGTALAKGGTAWLQRGPDFHSYWSDVSAFQVRYPASNRWAEVQPSCNENQPTKRLDNAYFIWMLKKEGDCYELAADPNDDRFSATNTIYPYPNHKDLEEGAIYKFNNFRPCPAELWNSGGNASPKVRRVTFAKLQNADRC